MNAHRGQNVEIALTMKTPSFRGLVGMPVIALALVVGCGTSPRPAGSAGTGGNGLSSKDSHPHLASFQSTEGAYPATRSKTHDGRL